MSFNSMNKVMLLGRLGRDPEMKYSQGGTAICNFSVATSESFKKGDDWDERTEWHRIVVFGAQAENCSKFLSKGSQVFLEGRIQTREYDDRDGNKKSITEIVANTVKFMDAKGEKKPAPQREPVQRCQEAGDLEVEDPNDPDLPF